MSSLENQIWRWQIVVLRLAERHSDIDLYFQSDGMRSCDTVEEYGKARRAVVDAVIKAAKVVNGPAGERAPCPLCCDEPESPYAVGGWAVPVGLDRHLTGWGSIPACVVMQAVEALAADHLAKVMNKEIEQRREQERQANAT